MGSLPLDVCHDPQRDGPPAQRALRTQDQDQPETLRFVGKEKPSNISLERRVVLHGQLI